MMTIVLPIGVVLHGARLPAGGLVELEAGHFGLLLECRDCIRTIAQQPFDGRGWLVSRPQPNHLRRRTEQRRHFGEVGVLRHKHETAALCVLPDSTVICLLQMEKADLVGTWEQVSEPLTKLEAKVLIEQQLHSVAAITRRSRSAA